MSDERGRGVQNLVRRSASSLPMLMPSVTIQKYISGQSLTDRAEECVTIVLSITAVQQAMLSPSFCPKKKAIGINLGRDSLMTRYSPGYGRCKEASTVRFTSSLTRSPLSMTGLLRPIKVFLLRRRTALQTPSRILRLRLAAMLYNRTHAKDIKSFHLFVERCRQWMGWAFQASTPTAANPPAAASSGRPRCTDKRHKPRSSPSARPSSSDSRSLQW